MRPGQLGVLMCGLVFVGGGGGGGARAEELACDLAEQGTVQVDGLLDDWRDVQGRPVGSGRRDLSFEVRCNYDDNNLYLMVLVQDDRLVRTRAQLAGEDHVEIGLPVGDKVERLAIYPEEGDVKQRLVWSNKRAPLKGVKAAESRQPDGWSVEVGLPLASLPEWTPGAPLVHVGVAVADSDAKGAARPERFLAMAPLDKGAEALDVIHFATGKASLEALLGELRLGPGDIKYDLAGRVIAGNKGRVLVVGKNLAVVGDEYAYVGLPVRSPADIKEMRVADLAGEGREAIVVRYVERGGGGMREVLAIYSMGGEGLRRMLGVEVAKGTERGDRRLETKVSFVPPKRRGQGTELVIEALPAVGWREADYREARDEELVPIPLPWSKERRLRFQFTGDGYTRLE
ncbi:MAG TPA: sugar-binding protein [Polyangia bacterium]|nr:sugar-binding protein [Polyangia bacterium]